MKNPFFTGACTALVTPFLNSQVNYPMVEQLLRRQIDSGIKTIVLAGTTGEDPTLSVQEKIMLFGRSKSYVGKDCTIIAGTGSNSTSHAIELSIAAESAGADALLIVSPYYNKTTHDGLITHYLSIATAVNIPIIMYNVPSRTGMDIPVSVYYELSKIPNIVGVKESTGDITKISRIMQSCGPDFCVWSGNDDMTVPVIASGGQGVISVTSNLYPADIKKMCDAALKGDFKTAAQMQHNMQPINDLLFCEVNPIPIKAAMKLSGYDCGPCRLPLSNLSSTNLEKLKNYLS